MRRRDISAALFVTAAGSALTTQQAEAQTCAAPCYARTAAEVAAGVTPTDTSYPPLYVDRYGTNTTPGTTPMVAAFQSAIKVAKVGGGTIRYGATQPYLLDAPLDLTFPVGGTNLSFAIVGEGQVLANTNNPPERPSLIAKHTGHVFDTTGNLGIRFENMSITTDTVTYPQTCFLRARNSDGRSRSDRMTNVYVFGYFSQTVDYNYGSEDDMIVGCQFYNAAPVANTSVLDITGHNIRGLTSTFTTISTGLQSCIDHKIFGGEFANFAGTTTSDVVRLDDVRFIKFYGPWMDSSTQSGSSSGRALVYIDGTNGAVNGLMLSGVLGEASINPARYGVLFSNHPRVYGPMLVEGCFFPNASNTIGGGTGASLLGLSWINSTNSSQGGNINFAGTMQGCQFDATSSTVVAGTLSGDNGTWNINQLVQMNGESSLGLRDYSQASGSQWIKLRNASTSFVVSFCDDLGNPTRNSLQVTKTGFGFNGAAAIAKPTVTGSKAGNTALASLLSALAQYGLITDSTT